METSPQYVLVAEVTKKHPHTSDPWLTRRGNKPKLVRIPNDTDHPINYAITQLGRKYGSRYCTLTRLNVHLRPLTAAEEKKHNNVRLTADEAAAREEAIARTRLSQKTESAPDTTSQIPEIFDPFNDEGTWNW